MHRLTGETQAMFTSLPIKDNYVLGQSCLKHRQRELNTKRVVDIDDDSLHCIINRQTNDVNVNIWTTVAEIYDISVAKNTALFSVKQRLSKVTQPCDEYG